MSKVTVGSFVIDKKLQTIFYGDQELKLSQKKFFNVLCILIDNHHQFVSREELVEKVWEGNYYVGEKAVTNAIWVLRKTFSEYDKSEYIVTRRNLGYRLVVTPKYNGKKSN